MGKPGRCAELGRGCLVFGVSKRLFHGNSVCNGPAGVLHFCWPRGSGSKSHVAACNSRFCPDVLGRVRTRVGAVRRRREELRVGAFVELVRLVQLRGARHPSIRRQG